MPASTQFTVNEIMARVLQNSTQRIAVQVGSGGGDGRSVGDSIYGAADLLQEVLNRAFDSTNNRLNVG